MLLLSGEAPLGLFQTFLRVASVVALGLVPWLVYRNRQNKRRMGIILLGLVVLFGYSTGISHPAFILLVIILPAIGIGVLAFRKRTGSDSRNSPK
ncbi:hypothetical protein [Hymenobacter wooponensis]|uniref:Uncharacterized protein n=1 Tax=Hymenobacter wooponensis TaxID=1525360 RepID=A0A4Z0MLT3_9BACT|nr:hypothetical protein [Hymenobacter wooponensis]TGD80521.1 hypothetical protein EU557_11855 [Hymenobacter wooponensis]